MTKHLKTKSHGGKRKGAGRPVTKESTIVMRIPESLVEAVKRLIKGKRKRISDNK